MHCPKCNGITETKNIDNIEIDVCAKCAGVWLDQDELRKAKDAKDPDLNWMDFEIWKHEDLFRFSQTPTNCPRCQVDMVLIDYADTGVEIDYCPQCKGTWLDEGEFEKIVDALLSELTNKSVPDYVKASLEEGKEIITGSEGFVSEWRDFLTVLRMFRYRFFVENPRLHDIVVGIQKGFPFR
jgi:Zn-finger nucleic acid-binding protein